ncbi:MAG: hypothetical protein KGD63_04675, partial [Candidatus Lokiarchaeota archaeon]|nr:hypothetical protein [Candidatus Lokiarchaeota archaeon]
MKKENSFKFRKVFVVVCCLMFIFPLGNNGILVSMAQDNDDDISSNFTHTEITALNSYSEGLIYQNSSYENSYRNIFQTGSFNQYLTEKNIILDNDYATDLNTSCLVSQYYLDDNINQMLVNDSELIQFYDGSYNFDFDLVSDFITNDTSGSGCSATEITLSNNHLNVLDMYDNSNSQVAWIEHDFKQYISSSTIEFYWYNTRIGGSLTRGMVNFYENATEIFRLHFSGTGSDANDLYIYDGGWSEIGSNVFVQETWYHLRIDYDIDLDTYDVFLDNVSLANDISFINDVSNGLSFMTIRTEGADISYHHYYDSFSITGINGYSLNDLYLLTDMETYTDDFIDFYIFNERNLYEIGTGSYKTYLYFGLENMSLYLNSENIFNRINYSVSYINSLEFEIQYILFTNVSGTWLNAKYSIFINNVLIYEKYTYRQLMYLVGYDWMLYLENDKLYSFLGNNINCIRGIRHLYKIDGNTAIFYDFPRFNDQIIFDIPITPEFYDETKYWSYITFQLEEDFTENVSFSQEIKIGNELKLFKFAYNFTHTKAVIFNAKYNYYDEVIKNRDWGNWGIFNW